MSIKRKMRVVTNKKKSADVRKPPVIEANPARFSAISAALIAGFPREHLFASTDWDVSAPIEKVSRADTLFKEMFGELAGFASRVAPLGELTYELDGMALTFVMNAAPADDYFLVEYLSLLHPRPIRTTSELGGALRDILELSKELNLRCFLDTKFDLLSRGWLSKKGIMRSNGRGTSTPEAYLPFLWSDNNIHSM